MPTLIECPTCEIPDLTGEHRCVEYIICDCNDPSCIDKGVEGEVAYHVESCSCSDCHHALGKL